MPTKYRKVASERKPENPKRTVKRYPELRLAAEIAGVSYWTAYKVKRGQAQSEKVSLALEIARERLKEQRAQERKVARQKLRELRAEEKKIVRAQRQIVRALDRGRAA